MKILHIITSLRTGGAERLVTDLLTEFRAAGHEPSLLVLDGTRTPLMEELEAQDIRIDALSRGVRAMRNPLLLPALLRYLKSHPADIVHTHNSSCQLLGALASLRMPLRLVTTEHNTTNRRRAWAWYRPLDRWMYGRYRRIACVGEETRTQLLEYLGDKRMEGKTEVIPNGIGLSRFRGAVPDPEILSIPGPRITMAAAFRAQKDHPTLIRAMRHLPASCTLLLAGGAETPQDRKTLQACRQLVRDLDLEARVRFLGARKDIPGLYAASDVIVLSSHYEGGTPLAAIEGMAAGKIVIASDGEGLRRTVGGAGLLFPCGDDGQLARLIRRCLEDPDFSGRVRAACQARAARFDIRNTAQAYLALYRNLNFSTTT